MAKILSMEVGYSTTRICEIDYRVKSPKVYRYLSIPTPAGVLEDGFLTMNEEFTLEIKRVLMEKKIKTRQVVFSVASSKIATREVMLPAVKLQQVDALVKANASDYFPIDLTDYEVAGLVLGTHKEEGQADRYRVLVMAVEKKLVEGYEKLADAVGLHLAAMDYSGNSIYQIMRGECKEETEMVLKIEERATIASIIQGGSLLLQRNLAYGVDDAVHTLARQSVYEESSYEDALALMKRKTCIKNVLSETTRVIEAEELPDENERITAAKKEITASLATLIGNVQRVADLYQSKNPDHPIKKVRVIGLGGEISGLSKLVTNELGISAVMMKNLHTVSLNRVEGNVGRYVACIGAAIAPVGFVSEEKKKTELQNVNYRNVAILAGVFFALLSAAFIVLGKMELSDAKAEQKRLQDLQRQYEEAEKVYNTYNSVTAFYDAVREGYAQTQNPNDNLLAFLTELEEKLPADSEVTDFSSDSTQAVISLTVSSKEEAAKVIQTLRGFDSIMDVSIGAVNKEDQTTAEEGEEEEEPRVLFSLVCTYYPVSLTEETTAE